jgi:hypothetical protein
MIKKIIRTGDHLKVGVCEYITGTLKEVSETYHSVKADFGYAVEQVGYNHVLDKEIKSIEISDSLINELNDNIVDSPRKFTSPV